MTLTEFLLARIAEDEAAANAAHRESMRGHAGPGFVRSRVAWASQAKDVRGHELIERFTPARALAECEAKRRIVERFAGDYPHPDEGCGCYESPDGHHAQVDGADTLLDLASVYADHPDYRQEWKP